MALSDLRGKNAFITGGSSGIALGMTQAFVGQGIKVMIDKMLRSLPERPTTPN